MHDIIDTALRDNFDTPTAMHAIQEMICYTNKYMMTKIPKPKLIKEILDSVTNILTILGFTINNSSSSNDSSMMIKFANIMCAFRDKIRTAAKSRETPLTAEIILKLTDEVRDITLPSIGVKLEDRYGQMSIWKLSDVNKEH